MRQRFEWSSMCALAPLTALLAGLIVTEAKAGDSLQPRSLDGGVHEPSCGAPGEACAHISGYIKAGSESSARETRGQPTPSLLAGVGALGHATADALSRGIFFLDVSHDEPAR